MEASFGREGMTAIGPKECPNADDIGAALHFLVQAFDRVRAVQLGAVLARKGHIGQHIMLAPRHGHSDQWRSHGSIHQISQLWPAGAQLPGHLAPCLAGMGAVGLVEGLPDRGGDDGVLAARGMREGVAQPMNPAALPGCLEDPGDGRLEAAMCIANHQPDPAKAAGPQGTQELGPEGLGLRRADAQADDFSAPFGVGGDRDYGRDRHDATALAHLQVGGVQPEVGPFAGQWTVQKLADPFIIRRENDPPDRFLARLIPCTVSTPCSSRCR